MRDQCRGGGWVGRVGVRLQSTAPGAGGGGARDADVSLTVFAQTFQVAVDKRVAVWFNGHDAGQRPPLTAVELAFYRFRGIVGG